MTFDPESGLLISATTVDSNGLDGVACVSSSQCTAVDDGGGAVTFDPGTGSLTSGPSAIDADKLLLSVACPATNQCTAVDNVGQAVTFDPTSGMVTAGVSTIDGGNGLYSVACSSGDQCTAVDDVGQAVTFDPDRRVGHRRADDDRQRQPAGRRCLSGKPAMHRGR